MIDFTNTEIAFRRLTDTDLIRAYSLFKMLAHQTLVKVGTKAIAIGMKLRLPVGFLVEQTIYKHFCGGDSIDSSQSTIESLAREKVSTILDYSVEGKDDESAIDATCAEIKRTIDKARTTKSISFCVFKPTGIARVSILEKVSSGATLNKTDAAEFERARARFEDLCREAARHNIRIFIDAEDSWYQKAIDDMALDMMRKYNREKPLVHTTLQMYRHDRLAYLKEIATTARKENFCLGIKLVRGAYMEKERERASAKGYPSPIQPDKECTDRDYDAALTFMMDNVDLFSICAGSHNEASNLHLVRLIEKAVASGKILEKDVSSRVHFSQLLGMSDHLSFNLAHAGFAVSKYVPYGPVREVLPYLTRRAEENTSIRGQTGREMSLIQRELGRRHQRP